MSTSIYKSTKITTASEFYQNQNVEVELDSDNILTVTSQQDSSTPGILLKGKIALKKNKVYELIAYGRKLGDAHPYLWAERRDTGVLLTGQNDSSRICLPESYGYVRAIIGGYTEDVLIRAGVLFHDPSVNDSFELVRIGIFEVDALILGQWRMYSASNRLLTDRLVDDVWKTAVMYTKT